MNKKILILIALIAAILSVVIVSTQKIRYAQATMAGIDTKLKIIIDPGHGGFDGGAVGIDGTVEKDINLEISLKLREILLVSGFDVIMTREDDRSIHDNGLFKVKNQKTSDMQNRLKLIQANPDALFISIHQNKFPQQNIWGAQVFYSTNNEVSKQFAGVLQSNLKKYLQPQNNREIKPADNGLYLLYNAEIPAVLVECGFISNAEECNKLKTEEYQKDIAYVIYYSIMNLQNEREVTN
ncbi:MAG: N-acetylmuramoyl-L-alanine amidase CwlD [Oscillospiraceae bacterium]